MSSGHLLAASLPKVENTLYVDATYGDDASGERENPAKPYKTIQAAIDAATTGDRIVVNGDYVITSQITIPVNTNIIFDFLNGSSITASMADELINSVNSTATYEVHGRGVFRNNHGTPTSAVRALSGYVDIFGAKSISVANGALVHQTQWKNIRNVDEFYTEAGSILTVGANALHDGLSGGFIENVLFGKIGHAGFSTNGIVINASPASIEKVIITNCRVIAESVSGLACILATTGNGNKHTTFNHCKFIGNNRQRVLTPAGSNTIRFNECYFENNADLVGITIANSLVVEFENCSFKSNSGAGPMILSNLSEDNPPKFIGLNKFEAFGTYIIIGKQETKCPVYGSILGNKAPTALDTQQWNFLGIDVAPTTGDTFTAIAKDASTASYVVQALDTESDVYDGLVAACQAEALLGVNDFQYWSFIRLGAGPFSMRAFNTDADHNYDIPGGEAWTWSTDGTDAIVQPPNPTNGGFVNVGGNVDVDDNLIVV